MHFKRPKAPTWSNMMIIGVDIGSVNCAFTKGFLENGTLHIVEASTFKLCSYKDYNIYTMSRRLTRVLKAFIGDDFISFSTVECQPRVYSSFGKSKTSLVNCSIETAVVMRLKQYRIPVLSANVTLWQRKFNVVGRDKSVQYYLDKEYRFIKNQELLMDNHQWDAGLIALFPFK